MIALIVGGVIALALAIFLAVFFKLRNDPRAQIRYAEKAADEGNADRAEAGFRRTLMLLEDGRALSPELREIGSRAHFALAAIESAQGNRNQVAQHYADARDFGASLTTEQTLLLAEWYAERKEEGEEAIGAYLAFLQSGPRIGPAAIAVYAAMHNLCRVSEEMKAPQRRPLVELNRKVITINPGIEWAHYFWALGALLDGRAAEAIPAFMRALTLNPQRMLTYYWLAVCHLQVASPSLEAAMDFIDQFLVRAQKDGKNQKREMRVCVEISRRLIDRAGGLGASTPALTPQQDADFDKAIHYLKIAGERQPADAATFHNLGRVYRRKGSPEEALAALRKAAENGPAERLYAFDLGMQCIELGRIAEAIQSLERAVQISPAFEEAHGELARIYFEQRKFDLATPHFQAAFASGKRNPRMLGMWIRALFEQGQYPRVIDEVDRRKADPTLFHDDPDAAYATGRSYCAQGRFNEAISWLSKAAGVPAATYYLGCARANLKEFPAARACFDQLIASGDAWSSKALLQRGNIFAAEGDQQSAAEDYRKVIAAEPANCPALQALGGIALANEDFANAADMFSAAVAAQPQNMQAQFLLGVALERQGSLDEALKSYENVSRSERPENALLRMGVIHCRKGAFGEALKVLGGCVEDSSNIDTLLFYRGLAFALLGRSQDAIREWSKLEKRHPENERLRLNLARARYLLGSQMLARGERDAALAQWEQYLALNSLDESVAKDVGELTFQQALDALAANGPSDLKTARGCLQKALQRDPANPAFRFYMALCDVFDRSGDPFKELQALADEKWCTPRALYHLGWSELQRGRTDAATAAFRQVQACPDADGYRDYASWALANTMIANGEFQEASRILMSVAAPAKNAAAEVCQ
jgi:tetratricopeptide (TPR) repeat protein